MILSACTRMHMTDVFIYRLEALKRDRGGDLEVAIDPEALEGLDQQGVNDLYESARMEKQASEAREVCYLFLFAVTDDLSGFIAPLFSCCDIKSCGRKAESE